MGCSKQFKTFGLERYYINAIKINAIKIRIN
jgi:hypothetical protein